MRFPTGNSDAIKRLSQKSLRAHQTRNIIAVIAIALTTILFTTVFTIGMGMKSSFEESTFRMVGGYAHGTFKDLNEAQYQKLKRHPQIKASGYSIFVGAAENKELLKHRTEIRYMEEQAAKWMYIDVEEGRMPQTADEVALDTTVLDLLGIPHKLGAQVPIQYRLDEEVITKELILTGYWDLEKGLEVSQLCVAKPFVEENLRDLTEEDLRSGTGKLFMDVMVKNASDIEKSMYQIAEESGFIPDGEGKQSINVGVNWAYMNARGFGTDPMMILAVLGACLLIMFTGYLIIYNVFQISVMADIRFYGLLKTIGTTPKQIKRMIRRQALYLSLVGIPTGIMIGYIIGNGLLPLVMATSTINGAYASTHPLIFVGSAVFALITVIISCRKPGKIAASISPIEATKYSEVSSGKIKSRKVMKNNMLHMAYRNMTRNKKKTAIVITSMSLSLILLNSVYTYTQGFDMEKYLSKNVVADFVLGNANYFSVAKHFRGVEDKPSSEYIETVKKQEGVQGGGYIYYDVRLQNEITKNLPLQLYGIEDDLLGTFDVIEGEIDLQKFKTGDYIIEAVGPNDYNEIEEGASRYAIGEKVTIASDSEKQLQSKTYEVMAKIKMPHNATVRYTYKDGVAFFLSADQFKAYVKEPLEMAYFLDVAEGYEEKIEAYLEEYTTRIAPDMDYESKHKYEEDFKSTQDMFFTVGMVASVIIGLIGMVNFVNAIITSILARRGEFAILQSIGMTNRQLRRMLILEGLLYSVMTLIVAFGLGTMLSFIVVKPLGENLWFFTYHFKLLPLILLSPGVVALGVITPFIVNKVINKQTIVERLRRID